MIELDEKFSTMAEWQSWSATNASTIQQQAEIGNQIVAGGFTEPLTGRRFATGDIFPHEGNWREGIVAGGLNSRMRAVLAVLNEKIGDRPRHEVRIFGAEAVTSFALLLRGHFSKYLGSEFAKDEAAKTALFPIQHQDLEKITLPDASFDLVTTNEVLEHVPNADAALKELARILVPGGWHVGTFPFAYNWPIGDVRARIINGRVVNLKPEERHGNPVDPDGGSLVFETPGWDIVVRARRAGFSEAHMRFVASSAGGYLTNDTLGVFVFCARK